MDGDRSHDVSALTPVELERARRDLQVSLSLVAAEVSRTLTVPAPWLLTKWATIY